MSESVQCSSYTAIDPATTVGLVSLTVADLARSVDFYTRALGMISLDQTNQAIILGTADTPLLLLKEEPGVCPWPTDRVTGLYHFAILLPTQADLGLWLRHWLAQGYPFPGQADHLVSEAFYIRDPDEHGIEIYRDRPRNQWVTVDGQLQMGTDPIDMPALLAESERAGKTWTGMPVGTRMGHIHLQVGDIAQTRTFYHDLLGFDIMVQMPTALFVSAGGYHHHLGLNTWHSRNADPASDNTARMLLFTIDLPSEEARVDVVERLDAAGIPHSQVADAIAVRDPWQNTLLLQVNAIHDFQAAARLASHAYVNN
jgi:catechol 2,3-dioxygenase